MRKKEVIIVSIEEREIIDGLSNSAKKMFYSLDRMSQKRLIKKAKELAIKEIKNDKSKRRIKTNFIKKSEFNKIMIPQNKMNQNQIVANQMNSVRDFTIIQNPLLDRRSRSEVDGQGMNQVIGIRVVRTIKRGSAMILEKMLLGTKSDETTQTNELENVLQNGTIRRSSLSVTSKVKMRFMKTMSKGRFKKQAAINSANVGGIGVKGLFKSGKKSKMLVTKGVSKLATNPVTLLILMVVIFIGIVGGTIGMVVGAGGAEAGTESEVKTYQCQITPSVEKYRGLVETYCEKHGIPDYVDIVLAIIQQESAGQGVDVMQSSASGYAKNNPVLSAEESIDAGVHAFADCIKVANCKSPSDMPALKLAIQGYNYGPDYISWALEYYGGYTNENAASYSINMALNLGWTGYGDTLYVEHVLRYYVENETTEGLCKEAEDILFELDEENDLSEEVYNVISKGASLIGKVNYSMEKRQGDGREKPTYLDCSSFVAWSFHKCGYSGVPYSSTTATFIESEQFKTIDAGDLRPGDIGLINSTAPTGGANHVGIYCGKLKNGTKVWLHCTSSSGTSLTGNTSGPMFGAYTGFGYFRRFKKFE